MNLNALNENLNALNAIVDNIKNIDKKMDSVDLTPVFNYIVEKHNETMRTLKEVYEFVEKNFDIFENPKGGWTNLRNLEYYTNFQIGTPNIYNCVLRDKIHESNCNIRKYWVDNGIIFFINPETKKVCYLTDLKEPCGHGYSPNIYMWNTSYDGKEMNMGVGYGIKGWSIYDGKEVDWDSNMWTIDTIPNKHLMTKETIADFRKMVEADLHHSEKIVERLFYTISKINESVITKQNKINETLDKSVIGKTTKYVIEITKIEN